MLTNKKCTENKLPILCWMEFEKCTMSVCGICLTVRCSLRGGSQLQNQWNVWNVKAGLKPNILHPYRFPKRYRAVASRQALLKQIISIHFLSIYNKLNLRNSQNIQQHPSIVSYKLLTCDTFLHENNSVEIKDLFPSIRRDSEVKINIRRVGSTPEHHRRVISASTKTTTEY